MEMNNKNYNIKGNYIITEDGLFYSNYDKYRIITPGDPNVYDSNTILGFGLKFGRLSEYIGFLSEMYGVRFGKPQPYINGEIGKNHIGLYIVDYQKYLNDMQKNSIDDTSLILSNKKSYKN